MDIEALAQSPAVPYAIVVSGLLHDVTSGQVELLEQPILRAPSQDIYLPRRYEPLIRKLSAEAPLATTHRQQVVVVDVRCRLVPQRDDEARDLERNIVDRIGPDIGAHPTSVAAITPTAVLHVDLPMNDPGIDDRGIDDAVEQLRSRSFAFASRLSGSGGHDVLRLQLVASLTAGELHPTLVSAEARALMSLIREELFGSP